MSTLLDQELKTYAQRRDQLLGSAEGKFVLIKGDQVVGIFDSKMDAVAQGSRLFGNVPFLVKQVVKIETPQNLVSNLLGD
jgi:hypothetical protein